MTAQSQPLVTIATTVWNGERFLAECAESVLRQTYSNWQYYIIDNCSSDRTPEIAQQMADRDPRVHYRRHEEFVSTEKSYNRGFAAVDPQAAYVKLVDSDDWIYPECIERMVSFAEGEPNVGLVAAYRLDGMRVDLVNLPYTQSIEEGRKIVARSLVSPFSLIGPPTGVLWRADIVRSRQPFFDETSRDADADAGYWTLMRSNYGLIHQVLTYSRRRDDAETIVSDRLAAWRVDRLRLLIRWGPEVFSEEEYQRILQQKITDFLDYHRRLFVWWHLKSRFRQAWRPEVRERREYHRQAVELIAEEAPDSPEVQRMVRTARFLLR